MIILSEASNDGVPVVGYLVISGIFFLAYLWHYTELFDGWKKK